MVWTLLLGEEERLRRDHPTDWAAGVALAAAAGFEAAR
jgi:hypothetical protein